MTFWKYRAMIVAPATDQDGINQAVAAGLDTAGGLSTLTIGLSSDGTEPATHYWCSSKLTRNGLDGLKELAPQFPDSEGYVWSDPEDSEVDAALEDDLADIANVSAGRTTPAEILAEHGLAVIQSEEV